MLDAVSDATAGCCQQLQYHFNKQLAHQTRLLNDLVQHSDAHLASADCLYHAHPFPVADVKHSACAEHTAFTLHTCSICGADLWWDTPMSQTRQETERQ